MEQNSFLVALLSILRCLKLCDKRSQNPISLLVAEADRLCYVRKPDSVFVSLSVSDFARAQVLHIKLLSSFLSLFLLQPALVPIVYIFPLLQQSFLQCNNLVENLDVIGIGHLWIWFIDYFLYSSSYVCLFQNDVCYLLAFKYSEYLQPFLWIVLVLLECAGKFCDFLDCCWLVLGCSKYPSLELALIFSWLLH